MHSQILLLFTFLYAGFLFFIAWCASRWTLSARWIQPLVYSFSLSVYCSSWTFMGAVGKAVDGGWGFFPIYLGPIMLFVFGWRFIRRLLVMCSRNKVTSIADFIGSRYGKNQGLAAAVTIVAVVGSLPYIALQLKAVSLVWETVNSVNYNTALDTTLNATGELSRDSLSYGSSLITACLMAWFAILFGTREIDGPRRHRGLMTSVAIEALIKLIVFCAVGLLALQLINTKQLLSIDTLPVIFPLQMGEGGIDISFVTQTLLGMAAIICLPRQFHVLAVEPHSNKALRLARWLFPIYLLLVSVAIFPIAIAGNALLSQSGSTADAYVLLLPMSESSLLFTTMAFLGALSAATGMVVVATITLSIMISNELIVPVWLKFNTDANNRVGRLGNYIRLTRRCSIVALLVLAWVLEQHFSQAQGLAAMGLISFSAAVQLMPSILAGLYWPKGHRNGVLAGVVVGLLIWFYCLLLPALLGQEHTLLLNGPWHVLWLSPVNLFGLGGAVDTLSYGVFWSLLLNTLVFVVVSKSSRFSRLDIRQSQRFTQLRRGFYDRHRDFEKTDIEVRQLQMLLQPLLGSVVDSKLWWEFEQRLGHRLLPHDKAPRFVVKAVEGSLAAIVGAVSASRAIELVRRQQPLNIDDFVSLVGSSSRQLQFSRELLQTTLETIPQGVSVVDDQQNLIAWNNRYETLFDYPPRLLYIGCPIIKIYQYNAERGYLGNSQSKDIDQLVQQRMNCLRTGGEYRIERRLPKPGSKVIEICGTPIGNGGYVTTYTDISDYHEMLQQLEQAKERLEERVNKRTAALSAANASLNEIHVNKSRFLAAASHDLLQPISAARLFVATIQQKAQKARSDSYSDAGSDRPNNEHSDIDANNRSQYNNELLIGDINQVDDALANAENLINALREISRLDSGKFTPQREHFMVGDLLKTMATEFTILAKHKHLDFRFVTSSQWIYTDKQLLRRVLQNFLSNALSYTQRGKLLLGCRRVDSDNNLHIEVWDTGIGIAECNQIRIFDEFERLERTQREESDNQPQGLGLGLSIVNRIAALLDHKLSFYSRLGVGSVFRISVPLGMAQTRIESQSVSPVPEKSKEMAGLTILCIDNDQQILSGLEALLKQWGCHVLCAVSLEQALALCSIDQIPDIIIVDYHLHNQQTGLDVLLSLTRYWNTQDVDLSAIVFSANNTNEIRQQVKQAGYIFLPKPLRPAALRSSIRYLTHNMCV